MLLRWLQQFLLMETIATTLLQLGPIPALAIPIPAKARNQPKRGGDKKKVGNEGQVEGDKKKIGRREEILQPVEVDVKKVSLGASVKKAAQLLDEMQRPWEGMDNPTRDAWQDVSSPGIKPSDMLPVPDSACPDCDPEKSPERVSYKLPLRAVPPVRIYTQLLFDPNDLWRVHWRRANKEREDMVQREVAKEPFSPLRAPSFMQQLPGKEPQQRNNPAYYPHVITHYRERVPSTDQNANPLWSPLAAANVAGRQDYVPRIVSPGELYKNSNAHVYPSLDKLFRDEPPNSLGVGKAARINSETRDSARLMGFQPPMVGLEKHSRSQASGTGGESSLSLTQIDEIIRANQAGSQPNDPSSHQSLAAPPSSSDSFNAAAYLSSPIVVDDVTKEVDNALQKQRRSKPGKDVIKSVTHAKGAGGQEGEGVKVGYVSSLLELSPLPKQPLPEIYAGSSNTRSLLSTVEQLPSVSSFPLPLEQSAVEASPLTNAFNLLRTNSVLLSLKSRIQQPSPFDSSIQWFPTLDKADKVDGSSGEGSAPGPNDLFWPGHYPSFSEHLAQAQNQQPYMQRLDEQVDRAARRRFNGRLRGVLAPKTSRNSLAAERLQEKSVLLQANLAAKQQAREKSSEPFDDSKDIDGADPIFRAHQSDRGSEFLLRDPRLPYLSSNGKADVNDARFAAPPAYFKGNGEADPGPPQGPLPSRAWMEPYSLQSLGRAMPEPVHYLHSPLPLQSITTTTG